MSNPGNVIGGHKSKLKNPNTSDESKEHSKEVIADIKQSGAVQDPDTYKNSGNVVGGHKANLKNPNTSDESKEHSKEVLEDASAI